MKLSDIITNRIAINDSLTKAIVRHLDDCELTLEEVWDDDQPRMYQLPESNSTLMICGDDSWGAVIGVVAIKGHLVLIASFGDDGPLSFSPTLNRGKYTNPLTKEKEWVNALDESDIVATSHLL